MFCGDNSDSWLLWDRGPGWGEQAQAETMTEIGKISPKPTGFTEWDRTSETGGHLQ